MYQQISFMSHCSRLVCADVESMLGAAAVATGQQRYAHLLRSAEKTFAVGMYSLKSLVSCYTCVHEKVTHLTKL